jgi:DNA-binding NarL/FixJ family response regulator
MCYNDLNNLKNYDLLTPQEQHLVEELLAGLTNEEIAGKLNISDKKLEPQLTEVYRKLDLDKGQKQKRITLLSRVIALFRGK